ncbi:MAG: hypothetical protein U0N03_00620 [Lachnospiraceae bacterium]
MAKKEKARNIRTVLKAVRVTEEEAMQLARQAEEYQMTESGYMRRKLFYGSQPRLPPETNEMLQRLIEQERRVGININQVVRSCNSKRFITKEDYQLLVKYLEEIRRSYQQFYQQLEMLTVSTRLPETENREEDSKADGSNPSSADQRDPGE